MTFTHHSALRPDGTPANVGLLVYDQVDVAKLRTAIDIVDDSGVEDMLATWWEEDGGNPSKGGRPRLISQRTALILMAVLAIDNEPLHITKAATILTDRATDNALKTLGLPTRDEDDYRTKLGRQCWYNRLWNTWHSIMRLVDLFPETPPRRSHEQGRVGKAHRQARS